MIETNSGVTGPGGFVAGAVAGGLKARQGALDVVMVASTAGPAAAAGVFTRNRVKAAPVLLCQQHLAATGGYAHAVVINSGQANACTGEEGAAVARATAEVVAERLGCATESVLVLSTGVIGVVPSIEKIAAAVGRVPLSATGGGLAAEGILTTDTCVKMAQVSVDVGGVSVTLGGMCKGSGMIHPNMATMLAVVTTDAAVEPGFLRDALRGAVDRSFNMVSVDGDTSTNDTVLVLANGVAGNALLTATSAAAGAFAAALENLCVQLAKQVARDGEGATKLIEVTVSSAATEDEARAVAQAVIGSSLVKSAVFGNDPNWGRIVCAAGYSGAAIDEAAVSLVVQGIALFRHGRPLPFDRAAASAALKATDIAIDLELGQGTAAARGWGCDLTYKYVEINAEYTT